MHDGSSPLIVSRVRCYNLEKYIHQKYYQKYYQDAGGSSLSILNSMLTNETSDKELTSTINWSNMQHSGNLLDENEVLEWMVKQKTDESIEEIDRETLIKYIETKEFLAVVFCKEQFLNDRSFSHYFICSPLKVLN